MKIKVRGFEMGYDDTGGAGVPLVLIHGYPLDRTLWSAQTRAFADIARVIAPDLRGFGESTLPGADATMDTYADDVRALLDALGIKNAIIAGLSMGGYIAFAFYRQHAHRVRALILADTRATADTPEGKLGRDASITLARDQGAGAIADAMVPKALTAQTLKSNRALTDATRDLLARQSVAAIITALGALRDRPDSTPTLAEISVPTLIIVGVEDAITPVRDAEMMRDAIRGARLAIIPNAGHLANIEQPDEFNRVVREFLQTV
ncbi:MAG: alpha/beta fold hydrolase [Chloroflexi bacterium]|nr:alpha/beta fold hydrolase [Chloroflexota bacterium]